LIQQLTAMNDSATPNADTSSVVHPQVPRPWARADRLANA
jgi:hypothetical protein